MHTQEWRHKKAITGQTYCFHPRTLHGWYNPRELALQ